MLLCYRSLGQQGHLTTHGHTTAPGQTATTTGAQNLKLIGVGLGTHTTLTVTNQLHHQIQQAQKTTTRMMTAHLWRSSGGHHSTTPSSARATKKEARMGAKRGCNTRLQGVYCEV
jgi:hypothetical protein